ncbi:unnamed protein product, partial [Pleuronectes platessa]
LRGNMLRVRAAVARSWRGLRTSACAGVQVKNEPILSFTEGSSERVELLKALDGLKGATEEIPCVVGDEHVWTSDVRYQLSPFNHSHKVAKFCYADKELINRAILASVAARREWDLKPVQDRAQVLFKAADVISGPRRAEILAKTMIGQGKTVVQAEIDAAAELIDFFRFNAHNAVELEKQQPLDAEGSTNTMLYRGLEPVWCRSGACLVPVWCRSGACLVPVWCRSGAGLEPVWSRSGACLVPVWCLSGAGLEPVWCRSGACLVPVWCRSGACLVPVWCRSGAGLVPVWCRSGAGLVPVWCLSGAGLVPVWCLSGAGLEPVWCRSGACLVPVWCRSGACLVPVWCRSGAGLEPVWCRSGAGLVPVWCRSGAGLVPVWCLSGAGLVPVWSRSGAGLVPVWYLSGAGLVPVWCLSGACLVPVWCRSGAGLVPVWCLSGACLVPVWCRSGACLVPVWFLSGACLVPVWCRSGACLVPVWCRSGACLVPVWCRSGAGLVPVWCRSGACLVPVWCLSGACLVPVWCRSGACLVPVWCRSGAGLVPVWCLSGAGLVLVWCLSGACLVPVWSLSGAGLELGFVAAVAPFNFTAIGGNLAGTPTLMGNVVLWKPSDAAMSASYAVYRVLRECGLPPNVVQFLPADGPVFGDTVTSSEHLAGINFTGSVPTFKRLWRQVGQNLDRYKVFPRLAGECGGKNFHFVHSSADVQSVVTGTIRSAFEYGGQKCSACSRMYVAESVWPQIKQGLLDIHRDIRVGDPVEDFSSFFSAVIDDKSFSRIKRWLDHAKSSASLKVIAGGHCDDSRGYFVEPTIIETTDPQDAIMNEEIFGPVLTVYVYPDNDYKEVLQLIDNTSPYALTGAVFAQDQSVIHEAAAALRNAAGNYYVNDKSTGSVVAQQPFGGARASGTNDKPGGSHYVLRWTSPQVVKQTNVPLRGWSYPYMG